MRNIGAVQRFFYDPFEFQFVFTYNSNYALNFVEMLCLKEMILPGEFKIVLLISGSEGAENLK